MNTLLSTLLKIATRESRPRSQRSRRGPHRRNHQWQLADLGLVFWTGTTSTRGAAHLSVSRSSSHSRRKDNSGGPGEFLGLRLRSSAAAPHRHCQELESSLTISYPFRVKLAKQVIQDIMQFDKLLVIHFVDLQLLFRPKMPLNAGKVVVDGTRQIGGAVLLSYLCGKFGKPLAQFNLISTLENFLWHGIVWKHAIPYFLPLIKQAQTFLSVVCCTLSNKSLLVLLKVIVVGIKLKQGVCRRRRILCIQW